MLSPRIPLFLLLIFPCWQSVNPMEHVPPISNAWLDPLLLPLQFFPPPNHPTRRYPNPNSWPVSIASPPPLHPPSLPLPPPLPAPVRLPPRRESSGAPAVAASPPSTRPTCPPLSASPMLPPPAPVQATRKPLLCLEQEEEEEGFEKVRAKAGVAPDFYGMKRRRGECSRDENGSLNDVAVTAAPPLLRQRVWLRPRLSTLLVRRSRQGQPTLHSSGAPVSWAVPGGGDGRRVLSWRKQLSWP